MYEYENSSEPSLVENLINSHRLFYYVFIFFEISIFTLQSSSSLTLLSLCFPLLQVWFQNQRAKMKKMQKKAKMENKSINQNVLNNNNNCSSNGSDSDCLNGDKVDTLKDEKSKHRNSAFTSMSRLQPGGFYSGIGAIISVVCTCDSDNPFVRERKIKKKKTRTRRMGPPPF